ncbi:hypothetical protein GQ457_13G000850 [Hibiscus cannabinus]
MCWYVSFCAGAGEGNSLSLCKFLEFFLVLIEAFWCLDNGNNETTQISSNVRKDLSDWQERHAVLVLSKVKELSQLRFKLCPRHFWRIYFMLVKSHVAEESTKLDPRNKIHPVVEPDVELEELENTSSSGFNSTFFNNLLSQFTSIIQG